MAKAKPSTDPIAPAPTAQTAPPADADAPTLEAADLIAAAGGAGGAEAPVQPGAKVQSEAKVQPESKVQPEAKVQPGAGPAINIDDEEMDPGTRLAAVRARLQEIGDPYARRTELIKHRKALLDEVARAKKAYDDRVAQVMAEYQRENERATMADGQRQRLLQLQRRLERQLGTQLGRETVSAA